jgi:hypothetical protein
MRKFRKLASFSHPASVWGRLVHGAYLWSHLADMARSGRRRSRSQAPSQRNYISLWITSNEIFTSISPPGLRSAVTVPSSPFLKEVASVAAVRSQGWHSPSAWPRRFETSTLPRAFLNTRPGNLTSAHAIARVRPHVTDERGTSRRRRTWNCWDQCRIADDPP